MKTWSIYFLYSEFVQKYWVHVIHYYIDCWIWKQCALNSPGIPAVKVCYRIVVFLEKVLSWNTEIISSPIYNGKTFGIQFKTLFSYLVDERVFKRYLIIKHQLSLEFEFYSTVAFSNTILNCNKDFMYYLQ